MILLIHREAVEKNPEKYPLNSNLILLILIAAMSMSIIACFKFQSDSINTYRRPFSFWRPASFKFQSDSINTGTTPAA